MSSLYFLLIPLVVLVLYEKVSLVIVSFKEGNSSKLKADLFFLMLVVTVIMGLVVVIAFI